MNSGTKFPDPDRALGNGARRRVAVELVRESVVSAPQRFMTLGGRANSTKARPASLRARTREEEGDTLKS
jgi:hypothetical protein